MRKLLPFTLTLLLAVSPAFGQRSRSSHSSSSSHSHSRSSAGRPYYGGGQHRGSHGGSYPGETNPQSHKGGRYKNPHSSDRYGIHK